MSDTTTNLGLVLPTYLEDADIEVINGNMETLDTAVASKANTADLADVATSGAYADLTGKPTVDSEISSVSTNAVQNAAVSAALTALLNNILGTGITLGAGTVPAPTAENKLDLDNISAFDSSLPTFGRITVGATAAANVLNLPPIGATYGFLLEQSGFFSATGRYTQRVWFNSTQEAGRYYQRSKYSNGWGAWYRYTGEAVS